MKDKSVVVLASNYKVFLETMRVKFMKQGQEYVRPSNNNPTRFTHIAKGFKTVYFYATDINKIRGLQIDEVKIILPYTSGIQNKGRSEMVEYLNHKLEHDVFSNKENHWFDPYSPEGQREIKLELFDELGD